jgi:hypothetical protein
MGASERRFRVKEYGLAHNHVRRFTFSEDGERRERGGREEGERRERGGREDRESS